MNAIQRAILNGIDVSIRHVEGDNVLVQVRKGDCGFQTLISREEALNTRFDPIDVVIDENCRRLFRTAGLRWVHDPNDNPFPGPEARRDYWRQRIDSEIRSIGESGRDAYLSKGVDQGRERNAGRNQVPDSSHQNEGALDPRN